MTGEGVFFVTRMKCNTVYTVEAECEVPAKGNVLRDQIISLPTLRKAGEEHLRKHLPFSRSILQPRNEPGNA
jgi:hypothetical protein